MPKNTKSSASSATRKKKAQKAAASKGGAADANGKPQPVQRGQKKGRGKTKEPKKKVYIPPVKPKADIIDPLDSLGLASLLPSDLVVLLRKAGKKDLVTRSRALEGFVEWIKDETSPDAETDKTDALIMAIPCWAHLFPRLSISPNRRLRQLASQCNSLLLTNARLFDELIHQIESLEAIIGGMFILAFDPDRSTARISKATWESNTSWEADSGKPNVYDHLGFLLSHISTIIFHQSDDTSSQAAKAIIEASRDAKNRDDSNVEEDVEGVDARLVYCAINAISWLIASQPTHREEAKDIYSPLLTSPILWSSLSPQSDPDQQRSLGILSPMVRVAAWGLIRTMAQSWKDLLDDCIGIMGYTALSSAFAERDVSVSSQMRDGLIIMLRERPSIWTLKHEEEEEGGNDSEDEDDDSESAEESEQSAREQVTSTQNGTSALSITENPASLERIDSPLYQDFLDWLSKGLLSTYSNYNIVILLVSTIPSDVFPPSSYAALHFLNAMYRPIGEREIEGREGLRNFLPALIECIAWTSARVNKLAGTQEAVCVVTEMTQQFCKDFIGTVDTIMLPEVQSRATSIGEDKLRIEAAALLKKLANISISLSSILLDKIISSLGESTLSKAGLLIDRNVDILRLASISSSNAGITSSALREEAHRLICDLCITTANIVASGEAVTEGMHLLSAVLDKIPDALQSEAMSSLRLVFDKLVQISTPLSSTQLAAFYIPYLLSIKDATLQSQSWCQLMDSLCKGDAIDWDLLQALMLSIKGREHVINSTRETKLDAVIQQQDGANEEVVKGLLRRPRPFLQLESASRLLNQIARRGNLSGLSMLTPWLQDDPQNVRRLLQEVNLNSLVPIIVTEALLHNDQMALQAWTVIKCEPDANKVAAEVLSKQVESLNEPLSTVISAIKNLPSNVPLSNVLPSREIFWRYFEQACECSSPELLEIYDQLVEKVDEEGKPVAYDTEGLSSYGRCSLALLETLEEGGSKAAWTLPHLISLGIAAEDAGFSSSAGRSHFATKVDTLSVIANRAIRAATSALSSHCNALDEAWFSNMAKGMKSNPSDDGEDEFLSMLISVWRTPRSARVFSRLLKGLINFSGAGEKECIPLLRLGQGVQDSAPSLASAIYIAIKDVVVESQVYDRLRNELAARLAGVPPSKAATEGVNLLSLLISVAPPEESFVALIPQQRSIFLLQTLQRWIASDESEEFPPKVHSLLMQLLSHLLPIVQDMPGSHLAFMCDMMDVNLSEGLENPTCVYHSLTLVEQFCSLAARNAMLRGVWNESKKDIFDNVHDLFINQDLSLKDSHQLISESLADAVRVAPPSLFAAEADVSPLLRLIQTGSKQTKILAYRLLSNTIRERVKELVVEIAVGVQKEINSDDDDDTQGAILLQAKVDPNLIDELLELPQGIEEGDLAFLLCWLALFDHFEESSLQVKAMLTSQLQNSGIVEKSLLPFFFFTTMDIKFDPTRWALDEVYLDEMESSEEAIQVLTAHIFYRSLIHIPNLIRESFNGIKDRQESLYLRNFIMRHLTPLLAQREFGHLRDASILDRLTDENMTIKVLAGSNEVIATYTVDEYPLEISIAMPNDYPLRNVEIKDLKKVGVSEGTWRAWILSIRQLIGSRNGLIFDALMLFKRNVEAKFSGFDEDSSCAVCYSIVSPTDHSLPTKPCKTCKKKFHASCLYKWVSTSGSSTCPLCRSIL